MDQDQEKALVETLTEGRGGAFFYYSHDRCVKCAQEKFRRANNYKLRKLLLFDVSLQALCHKNYH
jgi:hypothetical protein